MHKISAKFSWSPNGYEVEDVAAGVHEELKEGAVRAAKQLGVYGDESTKTAPAPKAKASAKAKAKAKSKASDKASVGATTNADIDTDDF